MIQFECWVSPSQGTIWEPHIAFFSWQSVWSQISFKTMKKIAIIQNKRTKHKHMLSWWWYWIIPKETNSVIIPSNELHKKNKKRTHPVGFFAPPHPGTTIHSSSPLDRKAVFFCSSRWVLLRLPEKHLWMDKKYWKWRNSRATWTKSHGFFRDFVALPHRSLRSFQMFVGSLYETKWYVYTRIV